MPTTSRVVAMKSPLLFVASLTLISCATCNEKIANQSNYSARTLADGTMEIGVTATSELPTDSQVTTIALGPMLESAATKECPSGHDVIDKPAPTIRAESKQLKAS